jgi:four helix bundle protein
VRYTDWQATVPLDLTADPLWQRQDYRLALYAGDLGWEDVRRLGAVRATADIADQLGRALGSITANIAEGYSRASGSDRARFYEYALGSARESRDWYHKGRHVLGAATVRRRMKVLTSVVRLLTYAIPRERGTSLVTPRAQSVCEPVVDGWRPGSTAVRMPLRETRNETLAST